MTSCHQTNHLHQLPQGIMGKINMWEQVNKEMLNHLFTSDELMESSCHWRWLYQRLVPSFSQLFSYFLLLFLLKQSIKALNYSLNSNVTEWNDKKLPLISAVGQTLKRLISRQRALVTHVFSVCPFVHSSSGSWSCFLCRKKGVNFSCYLKIQHLPCSAMKSDSILRLKVTIKIRRITIVL